MPDIDRRTLPIRRPPFAGVANRTLDGSEPDWDLIGHATPPDGAPNVLLVLIDDAGLRQPEHLRRSDRHTELHADGRGGPAVQPLPRHRALLADAGRAADRPQQPRRRLRLDRRVRRRLPGLHGDAAARLRPAAADPAGQRLQHRRVRQVAPDAGRAAGAGRAVRPLAERLGVRLLLRDPRWRVEPVGPVPGREPEDHRHPAGLLRRGEPLLPARRDGGQDDRVAARRPGAGRDQAVLRLLLDRLQPRAASRRRAVGGEVQGQVRPGLGPAARGDVRPAEGARRHPARRGADAAQRGVSRMGRRAGQAQAVLRAPDGGLRRLLARTPTTTSAA